MNVTEGDDTMTNMSKDKDKGKETDEIISAKSQLPPPEGGGLSVMTRATVD
jgi:hypothetical protein